MVGMAALGDPASQRLSGATATQTAPASASATPRPVNKGLQKSRDTLAQICRSTCITTCVHMYRFYICIYIYRNVRFCMHVHVFILAQLRSRALILSKRLGQGLMPFDPLQLSGAHGRTHPQDRGG